MPCMHHVVKLIWTITLSCAAQVTCHQEIITVANIIYRRFTALAASPSRIADDHHIFVDEAV